MREQGRSADPGWSIAQGKGVRSRHSNGQDDRTIYSNNNVQRSFSFLPWTATITNFVARYQEDELLFCRTLYGVSND